MTTRSTARSWSAEPYTIHVNVDPDHACAAADAAGALVLRWPLSAVRDRDELDASAAAVFGFPIATHGLAGLVDLVSDLEWLETEGGVVLVIDAAGARDAVVADVASILPDVADRWRSGSVAFEAFLTGVADVDAVAAALERANAALDDAGRVPWSRPDIARVPVVVRR